MSANTTPIYPGTIVNAPKTWVNADGTTKKDFYTAGAAGARIDSIHLCLDDTASSTVSFYLTISGTDYLIGSLVVPAGSGTGSIAWTEALNSINSGNALFLAPSAILKAGVAVAVTSAKTLTITAFGGSY